MTPDELKAEISKIRWWHSIDLGNGIVTPGADRDSASRAKWIGLPQDLHGLTVLDIGAWDGFFSFEAERRGASRVLATDSFVWRGSTWGSKAGFELARRALNSKVEDMEIDVLDLSPDKVGTFDLVLFLGVLYQMRHPLLALEKVYSVTKEGGMAIVETHVDLCDCEWPAMRFYPTTELNNDASNWWGPNPAAVVAMLESIGFHPVKIAGFLPTTGQEGRLAVHAWRGGAAYAVPPEDHADQEHLPGDNIEPVIEIRDPQIDAEAVMRRVRENISRRRAQATAEGLDYDTFLDQLSDSQATARFDVSLYRDLRWLYAHYPEMGVKLSLTPSPIPFIAPLIQRARAALHQLAIYYVNILAAQQRSFNSYLVQALTTLLKGLECGPFPDDFDALRREVAELRARVEQLEEKLAGSPTA